MNPTNTKELWDELWKSNRKSTQEYLYNLRKDELGPIWVTIRSTLEKQFGSLQGLNTIEIGAGRGAVSALLGMHGAQVTLLDYSEEAVREAQAFYRSLNIEVKTVQQDALDLDKSMLDQYDACLSFGLAEHFIGPDRTKIIGSHIELIKPGGAFFISVPNANCYPYRYWKWRRELMGKWHFGLEIPFSRRELETVCDQLGVPEFEIVGSPLWESLDFAIPVRKHWRSIQKRLHPKTWLDVERLKPPLRSRLDKYLGYALLLHGTK